MRRRFIQLVAACGAFLTGLFRALPALAYDGTISGNFAGVVPTGQHWHITGNVNLTGDLIVEGLLTGVDTFTLTGNGFQLLTQNGGRLDLAGKSRTAWTVWGDPDVEPSIGSEDWKVGDRLAVAPTAVNIFVPSETTWSGSWGSMARPANSSDVTLVDGTVRKPEVVNLSQTVVLQDLRRVHFHDGAGVQSLKQLKVLNSGTTGVLGDYPIHFHLNGEASRGSVLEDVVVEGGKNHAFVPHGSHGISHPRCAAYNTINDACWWDFPTPTELTANNSNDINWDDMLVMWVKPVSSSQDSRLAGFVLGVGTGNTNRRSVTTCVQGIADSAGFSWPEPANHKPNVWVADDQVAHNNRANGIFVWQNDEKDHLIDRFISYRVGGSGIKHGAYLNRYHYRDATVTGGLWSLILLAPGFIAPAAAPVIVEGLKSDRPVQIAAHHQPTTETTLFKDCDVPGVTYMEGPLNPSNIRYEDCGLVPADFTLTQIRPPSIIEIWEAGVLQHRWAGAWV